MRQIQKLKLFQKIGKLRKSRREGPQTLLQHVLALRRVLVISIVSVLICFILFFYFLCGPVMDYILRPVRSQNAVLIYTAVPEAMATQLRLSLVGGVVIASPVLMWQIWLFVKPALYPSERKSLRKWFGAALLLFLSGVAFCYFSVYKLAVNFFLVSGEGLAEPMFSVDKYLSFLLSFLLPFGLAFQLPIVIYLTSKLGLTTTQSLIKARKFVVLIIVSVSAILTPPDIVSQIMLSIPMLFLYEVGILVSRMVRKEDSKKV